MRRGKLSEIMCELKRFYRWSVTSENQIRGKKIHTVRERDIIFRFSQAHLHNNEEYRRTRPTTPVLLLTRWKTVP